MLYRTSVLLSTTKTKIAIAYYSIAQKKNFSSFLFTDCYFESYYSQVL